MADSKISALTADTSPGLTDLVVTVKNPGSTDVNRAVTLATLMAFLLPSGMMVAFGGLVAPTNWLLCNGAAVSRSTYSALFAAICPVLGTFTVTIATPAVVSLTAHGLLTGDAVYLNTTGALPTGLSANTLYYVIKIDANTFNLATSRANAYASTKIATSGSQSGTQTLTACPNGLGDGSTTFNVPDSRGRVIAGADQGAGILNLAQTQGSYGNAGASGGEQGHAQTSTEIASHVHSIQGAGGAGGGGYGIYVQSNYSGTTSGYILSSGSGTAANVIQPTLVATYIIKT